MDSIFKCQKCGQVFSYNVEQVLVNSFTGNTYPRGLSADTCPNCKHNYMDCQNLEECLEFVNKGNKFNV